MGFQWDAEQLLEPPQALKLIQEQFPSLDAKAIRLLGVGWDNTAFIVDEKLIFRFPRREFALPLLESEWALLPKLSSLLPLPIPVPKWKGVPTDQFPWPFIGYEMLPGFTACYVNLSEEQREALAEPIALFLKTLHQIPKIEGGGLLEDYLGRADRLKLVPKMEKSIAELSVVGLLENKVKIEKIVENGKQSRAPFISAIVHGDLYIRHLLLNEKHELAGVIDWGDTHFGDPAIDLAIAHSFLPKSAHDPFRKTYGEISEETWKLAQLRALHSSMLLVLFGHHSGDPALLREGLRSLNSISMS